MSMRADLYKLWQDTSANAISLQQLCLCACGLSSRYQAGNLARQSYLPFKVNATGECKTIGSMAVLLQHMTLAVCIQHQHHLQTIVFHIELGGAEHACMASGTRIQPSDPLRSSYASYSTGSGCM